VSDRDLAVVVAERLGADALRRLRSLRRRLWLRRSLRVGAIATAAAVGGIAVVQLAARTVALEIAPWLMASVAAVALLAWAIMSWRLRPSLTDAARGADAELALRERLGTALELVVEPDADDPLVAELAARQLADARSRLASADLRSAFRPRVERRPSVAGGVALALLVVLIVWPNPQDSVLRDRQAARDASRDVAQRIEDVARDAEQQGADTPDPRRDALIEQLRKLAQQLREGGDDRQDVLAKIGAVQEQLARLTDPQAAVKDAGLTQLAEQISKAATGKENANPDGDPDQAAKDLEALKDQVKSMSSAQAAARAEALQRAAQGAASTQPEVAQRLAEAADALDKAARTGDPQDQQAAEDALQRAADAVRGAEQDRQLQRTVARAQSALQDGARQVARAGQPQRANPEERVGLGRDRQPRDRLVTANVEQADRHGSRRKRVHDCPVHRDLLVLGWRCGPLDEQELGAEQADAFGAERNRPLGLSRRADVGQERDRDLVASHCRQRRLLERLVGGLVRRCATSLQPRGGGSIRLEHHFAAVAVDDGHGVLRHLFVTTAPGGDECENESREKKQA